ncbi:GNAT family N-acetyltransferase [Candidatus Bipolaricaulota bacterium]|nr:GNAT family N-acetyltransferase [Candidatus Bipolaricaulota bacterium]
MGWCAVAPREAYVRPTSSPKYRKALAPVDTAPAWAVVCSCVRPRYRRRGITVSLLEAAVAVSRGARTVEGYKGKLPAPSAWTGTLGTFLKVGFVEVARRDPARGGTIGNGGDAR